MERHTGVQDPRHSALQKQAIQEAKSACSQLPHDDAVFRQCVDGKETLEDVLIGVEQKSQLFQKKKSTRFLEKLQKHTFWLENISSVVDVAVQTQAGIACPLWAPIKFVLKISNDYSKATKHVLDLLDTVTECLPRLEIYEKLRPDKKLQVALLNVFTDVVDFAVRAFQFFRRGTIVRLSRLLVRSFDQDIGAVIARLERHARVADQTAVAAELLVASAFRDEAERRQHEELKIQCEQWLKPSDVKHVHLHQVSARLDGTCDWIASNDGFRRWVDPGQSTTHDRILVISGTHGCGKSVLASSIVVRLNKHEHRTLYFAFSSSDGSRQLSGNLIRTILWQLLLQIDNKESLNIVQRLRLRGQPTISELWEAFRSVMSSLAKPIYCVIDGVDECNDFDHDTCVQIMQSLEKCPDLRILLLGRPHVIGAHSADLHSLVIDITSTLLKQDIESFIKDEIAKSAILSLPELQETIFQILKDKSDGMFLWVRLMVDDLKRSSSKSELRERLQILPCGLEEAYQTVFLRLSQKLDGFQRRRAQDTLALMSVCCRPLQFDELQYSLALRCRSMDTTAQPVEEYLPLQTSQNVVDIFGGLVSITDGGSLQFIHSSVREFLVRPEDRWIRAPDRAVLDFRIDITQTHHSFACLCLDFMILEQEKKEFMKPKTSQSVPILHNSSPFFQYATMYTFYHLNRSGPLCSIALGKILKISESTLSVFWVESFAHFLFQDLALESQVDEFEALQERMAGAGLETSFLALFRNNTKEVMTQMRRPERNDESRAEQWGMFLEMTGNTLTGTSTPSESSESSEIDESTESFLEPSPAVLDSPARLFNSKSSPNDTSAAVSRIKDLLNGQDSLPIAHQIEILLRLQTSLRKARALIDPLRAVFRLILNKASSLPIYVLQAVAGFYFRLEKYQEALEVYTAASKKIDHLDVPLKYTIQMDIGECYVRLRRYTEAHKYYEKSLFGLEILLGKRHHKTTETLVRMIWNSEPDDDVLRCFDRIYMGQDAAPDLDVPTFLILQCLRIKSYICHGAVDELEHMTNCYEATLKPLDELYDRARRDLSPYLFFLGAAHHELGRHNTALGHYDTALDFFHRELEGFPSDSQDILAIGIKIKIGKVYIDLGRDTEAKDLLERTLAEGQAVLDPDEIDAVNKILNPLPLRDDHGDQVSECSRRRLIDSQH